MGFVPVRLWFVFVAMVAWCGRFVPVGWCCIVLHSIPVELVGVVCGCFGPVGIVMGRGSGGLIRINVGSQVGNDVIR